MASFSTIPVAHPEAGSDAEIARSAELRLQAGAYPVLKNVVCECSAGRLVLTGAVGSYYLKQMAQTLVARIPGVEQVDNQLEVLSVR